MSLLLPKYSEYQIADIEQSQESYDRPSCVTSVSALDLALQRERDWYQDVPRYQTSNDIYDAVYAGKLTPVANNYDHRKIVRFENDDFEGHQPFVSPLAWVALHDFGDLWRSTRMYKGIYIWSNIRMAVTSLTRSLDYQKQLIDSGQTLASSDSTHCTGNAMDIDLSGYYKQICDSGSFYSTRRMLFSSVVDSRRFYSRQIVSGQLAKEHGQSIAVVQKEEDCEAYDSRITKSIKQVATWMHRLNLINAVIEYPGSERECLHVAVNPQYMNIRQELAGMSYRKSENIINYSRFVDAVHNQVGHTDLSIK